MLNLNDREWRPFFLTELFPQIQRGKRLKTENHIPGKTPYVSSSALNNGVDNLRVLHKECYNGILQLRSSLCNTVQNVRQSGL